MKIFEEKSLAFFSFWSGAVENANMLTTDEMDEMENVLEEIYPNGMDATTINDLFWFDFEWVCECLGLEYNTETGEISRN